MIGAWPGVWEAIVRQRQLAQPRSCAAGALRATPGIVDGPGSAAPAYASIGARAARTKSPSFPGSRTPAVRMPLQTSTPKGCT